MNHEFNPLIKYNYLVSFSNQEGIVLEKSFFSRHHFTRLLHKIFWKKVAIVWFVKRDQKNIDFDTTPFNGIPFLNHVKLYQWTINSNSIFVEFYFGWIIIFTVKQNSKSFVHFVLFYLKFEVQLFCNNNFKSWIITPLLYLFIVIFLQIE